MRVSMREAPSRWSISALLASRLILHKLWRICFIALVLANLAYFFNHPLGWLATLGFFCFVPGYLCLRRLGHTLKSRWEIIAFSLGLSVLFLMLCGLMLNSLYFIAGTIPLTTINIFVTLNVATLILLYINRKATISAGHFMVPKKQLFFATMLLILPLMAAAGAMQLNNGVQSILPMIVFAAIVVIFLLFLWKEKLSRAYPYVLFVFALSVLLTVSMRGEGVTGHDILREYHVFQLTMQNGFWDIREFIDPYNACLSITLLPVIFAKVTHIADPYIFKVVFQVIFAVSIIPVYLFMKRLHTPRTAFMGAFLFLSFPTFLNDMPMLNRQEIGLLFFSLLMVLVLTTMPRRQKKLLTVLFLVGIILAHYSSGYIIIGLLFISWLVYLAISKLYKNSAKERLTLIFPTLNIVLISAGLLFAFLWNFQLTGTTDGLERTATKTFGGLFADAAAKSNDVAYSLFGGEKTDPATLLQNYVSKTEDAATVEYIPQLVLPLTPLGEAVSGFMNVDTVHSFLRSAMAKFIQLMLVVGCIVLALTYRKRQLNQQETYFMALIVTSIILIGLQTVLPQLSVDYGTLRLFQQLLIILAIPIVLGISVLFFMLKRHAAYAAGGVLAFLFLHLSGFLPQLTGGYPPQLSLNNAGVYYDSYYTDRGEQRAANWLVAHNPANTAVAVDPYALLRFDTRDREDLVVTSPFTGSSKAFVYKDRVNKQMGVYVININSNLYYYRVVRSDARENCLYSTATSEVCKLTGGGSD